MKLRKEDGGPDVYGVCRIGMVTAGFRSRASRRSLFRETRGRVSPDVLIERRSLGGYGVPEVIMKQIVLNQSEMNELRKPNAGSGGWQSLLEALQGKVNYQTGEITLTNTDIERIQRYAFDYGNGGWESRLIAVFGRHLGRKLGR